MKASEEGMGKAAMNPVFNIQGSTINNLVTSVTISGPILVTSEPHLLPCIKFLWNIIIASLQCTVNPCVDTAFKRTNEATSNSKTSSATFNDFGITKACSINEGCKKNLINETAKIGIMKDYEYNNIPSWGSNSCKIYQNVINDEHYLRAGRNADKNEFVNSTSELAENSSCKNIKNNVILHELAELDQLFTIE